ncbi:hypothetical protein EV191_108229 [Tamaricihabitans halophyticus]|uniref:Secreted protein n=1 Tax=Tamaricihabitans halophyticus TaxID=1262583 RepID=A0A4R2QKZ4_9PSEU|nr:hypothetical protein [Tamaricihabitans halophyticus]TCP50140.1 hypothetical protein EV191_108229 [Tamaricihabitans halophyticus]
MRASSVATVVVGAVAALVIAPAAQATALGSTAPDPTAPDSTDARAARAADPDATAAIGRVNLVVDGEQVTEPPIAPCAVSGEQANDTRGVQVGDLVSYGSARTGCAPNEDGTVTAWTEGRRFTLDALTEYGGPELGVRTYSSSCSTVENGSTARMTVGGVRGFQVPEEIPPNHTVLVPGANEGDPPMAKIVLNESIVPEPPTGELTVNTVRIELFPEGGPVTGEVELGSVTCQPVG